MESIQLKIEFENSLRRASVSRSDSLAKTKANISALIGITNFDLKYRDEENDLITIGSDQELQDVLDFSAKSGKLLRLTVVPRDAIEQDSPSGETYRAVEESPPEPEIPWIHLARALADAETVARIQQTLQSPAITEAINRASQAYIDSKGDTLVSGIVASQQIPSLLVILSELLEEFPILRDLQVIIMNWLAGNSPPIAPFAFPGQAPPLASPFGFFGGLGGPHGHHPFGPRGHHPFGPRHGPGHHHPFGPHHHPFGPHHGPGPHHPHHGPGPHHPHHGPGPHPPHHGPGPHPPHHGPGPHHPHHGPGPHHPHCGPHDSHGQGTTQGTNKQKHVGVFCDGCSSDPALKSTSVGAGHQTRRGFISGVRYKSQTVADFDLCESCKATDRFSDATYGPFTAITEGNDQRMRGCGGGGRGWWHDHREGGRGWWHDHRNKEQPNWRNRSDDQEKDDIEENVPQAEKQTEMDFFEAVRNAFSKGSEAFAQAAKNEGTDFSEIARAIAESLKVETAASEKSKTTPKTEDVPVATPAQPEDPFMKWSAQLQQLQVLGFDNLEAYIDILEEEKGDLDRVVNRIVVRDS